MEEFSFSTRIFFGEGALERLRRVQDKKVMIVTDRFMAGIGVPDKVAGHLTRCQVSVFDGVVPDPPIEVVAAGVQALQDCGAEVMIAVGGGSTIDAAKAMWAFYEYPETTFEEIDACVEALRRHHDTRMPML